MYDDAVPEKNGNINRWLQGKVRALLLELMERVDCEGKTQKEILAECREAFDKLKDGLYDTTSTMFSRFLRSITTIDSDTGKRQKAWWRDLQGRYWRWKTLKQKPALMEECMKARDGYLGEDAAARNELADELGEVTGHSYPKAYIVRQLDLNFGNRIVSHPHQCLHCRQRVECIDAHCQAPALFLCALCLATTGDEG